MEWDLVWNADMNSIINSGNEIFPVRFTEHHCPAWRNLNIYGAEILTEIKVNKINQITNTALAVAGDVMINKASDMVVEA